MAAGGAGERVRGGWAGPDALVEGWLRAASDPGAGPVPAGLIWRAAGPPDALRGDDARDQWFRLDRPIPPGAVLVFPGLATHCEVWLDGMHAASHDTMFRPLELAVPRGAARLEICARAMSLARVPGPRPRWRNRLVADEAWRGVRTSLLGRISGPGQPVTGPFRPVLLHSGPPCRAVLRAWMEGEDGVLEVRLEGVQASGSVTLGGQAAPLVAEGAAWRARLHVPRPDRWWPHTHGAPMLHEVHAVLDGTAVALGTVGFRTVERGPGPGFALRVNGEPVFCRGAVWSGGSLDRAVAAGFNMVRVPGYARYPGTAFYAACDALGLMVWQDFMFARFDYPTSPVFLDEARAEAVQFLTEAASHPAMAVLCGGDETMQAAAMAGRPQSEWTHPLFDDVLPGVAASLRPDVPYVPNAPCGAVPPFAASAPVAHYFGVGAYQRPLHEAAQVRFAAACLAFSNPPDPAACRALCTTPGDAAWAAAVPRDPGASWTFEDSRDHYAAALFGIGPAALRRTDPERWLAIGRAAVALAMQAAWTTWRADPGCGGALVLGWQDDVAGPGWGLLAQDGSPKSALHALAQLSRPVQVLLRDAGLDGVVVHLFNETAAPVLATLRLRGLRLDGTVQVLADGARTLPPRSAEPVPAASLMGRFQDLVGSWCFGPPPFLALGASLHDGDALLAEATIFPAGPALPREDVGLAATLVPGGLLVSTRRFAQFAALDLPGAVPAEDHVHLWPGESRMIRIDGPMAEGSVSALNALRPVHVRAA